MHDNDSIIGILKYECLNRTNHGEASRHSLGIIYTSVSLSYSRKKLHREN